MTVTCYYECPNCEKEIETEFDIGEHFCCLDPCYECGHELTKDEEMMIYSELEAQSMGAAIDRAEMNSDR
jgi:hypothetical protein